jgi:hypothetical protein
MGFIRRNFEINFGSAADARLKMPLQPKDPYAIFKDRRGRSGAVEV